MKAFVVFRRELVGTFLSPIAWVVAIVLAIAMARFFETNALVQTKATLEGVYASTIGLYFLAIPALTMGTLSQEFRTGTIEILATDPVRDVDIVLGKFLGVLVFFMTSMLPLPLFYILLRVVGGEPEIGPVLTGMLGILLAGSFCIAIGIFTSAMTSQQLIAYLLAALVIFFYRQVGEAEPLDIPDVVRRVFGYLSMHNHFQPVIRGRIALSDLVYFVGTTALFLFLATRVLEARRWA
jgi:ABC-2 type transport system permease protein